MKYGITYTPHVGIFKDTRCCCWREIGDPQLFDAYEDAEDRVRRQYGGGLVEKFDVRIEGESKVRAVCAAMVEHVKNYRSPKNGSS